MTYALIAPPAAEPVTLTEAKAHLRLDGTEEDDLILSLVKVAREHLERATGLALIRQTWRLYRDGWPANGVIQIARGPVQSIENVTVYDSAGNAVALPLDGHVLDGRAVPARLTLNQNVNGLRMLNGVEIDFTAGFGAAAIDVPDTLKRAILTHVAHMFSYRGVVSPPDQPAGFPPGYDRLIAPFEWRRL